jgi:hypothetical protein
MKLKSARSLSLLWLCLLPGWATVVGQLNSPDVSISGNLSARAIREDELLQFTLTIKSKADPRTNPQVLLSNLTLQKIPDGYLLDPATKVCVLPSSTTSGSCQTVNDFDSSKGLLAASLGPGQSLAVEGYLKPTSSHKAATLITVVAWTVAGASSSQSVTLGENQVQGRWQTVWTWLGDLVKLLAIPIVLALIGYGLNFLNRKHDERVAATQAQRQQVQHDHELQQAAIQHESDTQQAIRSETWKQMLLVSHNYAAKFYLPLSLAAERFSKNLKKSNHRVAFFYLLFSGKKVIATRNEIGGFYFKDLRGEALAANCWEKQRLACMGEEDTPFFLAVRASIDQLDDIESYEAFESMFASTPGGDFSSDSIQEAWTFFQKWVTDKKAVGETVSYLDGFTAVMDYESNRPYQYWYDTKPRLVATDDTKKLLREILTAEKYSADDIENYLSAVVAP